MLFVEQTDFIFLLLTFNFSVVLLDLPLPIWLRCVRSVADEPERILTGGHSYLPIFRDQQVQDVVVLDTLEFENLGQLKYFGQALTTKRHNGDIATFKDYLLKRVR